MKSTPGVGIPYREGTDPATVAADNEAAYRVIDARLVELRDRVKTIESTPTPTPTPGGGAAVVSVTHVGDGDWRIE